MEREFEWDEDKRLRTIEKHDVDFLRMLALFDGRPLVRSTRIRNGEQRFASTGEFEGKFYTVVWTFRSSSIRLITARRARDAEERAYRKVHG
ncbi:MAG: BrnT family toxin [Chloroflexia bacterium]|nr:BrnT family toxin [Chloroflexia bacterium]